MTDTIRVFNASANPQAVEGAGVIPPYERAEAVDTEGTRVLLKQGILKEVPGAEVEEKKESKPATTGTQSKKKPKE